MLDDYIFLILLIIIYLLMITYVELKRKGKGLIPGIICGIVQVASLYYFDAINESILALPAMEAYTKMQGTITTIVILFIINVALIVLLNLLVDGLRKKKIKAEEDQNLTDTVADVTPEESID